MIPDKHRYNLWWDVLATANACLGFTTFGYNMTIMGSVRPFLLNFVLTDTSDFVVTFIAACPLASAALGSLVAGFLALRAGRRKVMVYSDFLVIAGAILSVFGNVPCLIVGRLLIGINLGINAVAVALYFTEITPLEHRGEFTNGPNIFAAFGIIIAALLGLIVPGSLQPGETDSAWRVLLGLGMVPAILRIIGFNTYFRHETPAYYVYRKQYAKAAKSLSNIYHFDIVERIRELVKEREFLAKKGQPTIFQIFSRKFFKALLACIIMFSLEYLGGLMLILAFSGGVYAQGIRQPTNYYFLPQLLGICTAMINLFSAIFSIYTTSKFGRRPILIIGTFFTGLAFLLYGILARAVGPENLAPKIFLVLWPIAWNLSLGSVIFVAVAETLPDVGVSIATLCGWVFAYLTFQFFPMASRSLSLGWTFFMYGLITIVGSVVLYFLLVETRNKTKDQILREYSKKYTISKTNIVPCNEPIMTTVPDDVRQEIERAIIKQKRRSKYKTGAVQVPVECKCNCHGFLSKAYYQHHDEEDGQQKEGLDNELMVAQNCIGSKKAEDKALGFEDPVLGDQRQGLELPGLYTTEPQASPNPILDSNGGYNA